LRTDEDVLALLLAHGVAENAAKQTDVGAQGRVFFRFERGERIGGDL
jgi:hypothetical protein